jgi:hypothetical protein
VLGSVYLVAAGAFLGLLFLGAAIHKFADLGHFAAVLESQRLLPLWGRKVAVIVLPLLELGLGVGLLMEATRAPAGLAAAGLLALYGVVLAIGARRGAHADDCGCSLFGARPPSNTLVWRNGILVILALGVAMVEKTVVLPAMAWGNALAAGGAFFVLYTALEALAATRARIVATEARA